MKILFYINAIHHGGAERVMINLTQELASDNECLLVTSFEDEWEYSLNARVRRFNLAETIDKSFIKRNYILTKRLRKIIKNEKPDVCLSFMAEPNFRNIIASLGLEAKTVISVRNDPNKEYPNLLFKLVAKLLYPLANGIVFQTEEAKSWFSKRIQQKSEIIYNPVDNMFYLNRYQGKKRNIVSTGRLTSQKNHRILIEAFNEIKNKVSDNLIIYGEGELRIELEKLIKDLNLENRVFLPGAVKNVASTINSAKLFVLSSDYEGMPNSLMEAMALGIPCISTDCPCGGPRMLLKGKYLVPVKDKYSLAKAMSSIIEDTQSLIECGTFCKNCSEDFESTKIFMNWRRFLVSVQKSHRKKNSRR